MNQVHKENLTSVENALPNRQGLDIEIFGMEGVPEDIVQQHNQRIIQNFYTAQAERQAATGNPPRGQSGGQGPAKKIKMETPDELKKRLAEHRAKVAAQKAAAANGGTPGAAPIADGQSPGQGVRLPLPHPSSNPATLSHNLFIQTSPFPPPQPGTFPYPGAPPYPGAATTYPPASTYPPGASPPPGAAGSAFNLPARPPSGGAGSALPQRPPYYGAPPGFPGGGALTVDELVASAARQGGTGDDIDQLIRMAEAGIKPAPGAGKEEAPTGEKKGKKEMRMVYGDTEVSPEEKMAMLPRYRFVEEAAA